MTRETLGFEERFNLTGSFYWFLNHINLRAKNFRLRFNKEVQTPRLALSLFCELFLRGFLWVAGRYDIFEGF